jgi:RNA polymerase sigma-70 factor (ECF subfamily)
VEPDRDDTVRLRRGDLAGLGGLMERHKDRLFRYLQRLVGDEAMVEDLFQQSWIRVTERISRYDASRPFTPWLLALAHNLAIDQLRRYRPQSLEDVEPAASPVDEDRDGPLAARERGERLAAAIAALPALDREVLALRFEQDLTLSQLASVLGVPLPTAKARLYRALTRLRQRLLAAGPREEWR